MSLLCSIKFKHDGILRWYTIPQLSSVPLPLCFCCFCSFPFRNYFSSFPSNSTRSYQFFFHSKYYVCYVRSPLNFWMFFTTFSNFHLCSGLVYSQWMLVTSNLFSFCVHSMECQHSLLFLHVMNSTSTSSFSSSSSVQLLQFLLTHIPPVVGAFAVRLFATRRWTQNP